MTKDQYLAPRDVAKEFKICSRTLKRWCNAGKIKAKHTPDGKYVYNMTHVRAQYKPVCKKKFRIRYVRASSQAEIDTHTQLLIDAFPLYDMTIQDTDIDSERIGYLKLMDMVMQKKNVSNVVVASKDAIWDSSFEHTKLCFMGVGCKLILHN